jgi:protein gp37
MAKTKIEWTDVVWNPVTGCSKVSEGCRNCYAESLARRFRKDFKPWTAPNAAHNVRLHPERLEQPLRWSKPRRVFVNSVSDLFHEQVPPDFIAEVWRVMRKAPRHIFQVLTKRSERMAAFLRSGDEILPNIWLGVSAEDQPTFDKRVKYLLQTPAAKRFVSLEPLLGPVDTSAALWETCWESHDGECCEGPSLDWVIVGGESGPGARPCHPDWIRHISAQCQAAGTSYFFKQWGEFAPEGPLRARKIWTDRQGRIVSQGQEMPKGADSSDGWQVMYRVGKKRAGNVLDGKVWEEMPR